LYLKKGSIRLRQLTVNEYIRKKYGGKLYKIAINAGFTCPNRDGTLGSRGCIFCSGLGSGDFAESSALSVTEQIEAGKKRVAAKLSKDFKGYIAYFQAFTNTYAPIDRLRKVYTEAVKHPDVRIISIATRPDCLGEDVLNLLEEINSQKPVWVELGLQTIHEKTAEYIRRGYPLEVYDHAVKELRSRGLEVITHVILGLPFETREEMLETVKYVGAGGSTGIKLQLLHVLKNTDLAEEYAKGVFRCLTLEEYTLLVKDALTLLPEDMVIHRMTGDGDKKLLIAPEWSGDKKKVLNTLNSILKG
jgi:radical SAM protein (TIGR01212 family)